LSDDPFVKNKKEL